MMTENQIEAALVNQSRLLYSSGSYSLVSYSNTVATPLLDPMLTLVKQSTVQQAQPGTPVVFTVTVTNNGNRPTQVTLYDLLQEGTVFVPNSVHREGLPVPGADPVAGLNLGVLGMQETTHISFQLVAPLVGHRGLLQNQVRADYAFKATGDRVISASAYSNIVAIPVIPAGRPDLVLVLSVDKNRTVPGELVRYTAQITNIGDTDGNVLLRLALPAGTLYVLNSLTINGRMQSGAFPTDGIPLGNIAAKSKVTVTYDVTIPSVGMVAPGQSILNQAEAAYTSSGGVSPSGAEWSVSSNRVETEVLFPVISVKVMTNPPVSEPEGMVQFITTVANSGNLTANVDLTRLIPGQMTILPATIRIQNSSQTASYSAGTAAIGAVEPGSSVQVSYEAIVSPFVMSSQLRGNLAAPYTYSLNGLQYSGEVYSNAYVILIESSEE